MAEKFLRERHYVILRRNYRCPYGEIDLIARDGAVVVFVEVRSCTSLLFGHPWESVDGRKQSRIVRVASYFLSCGRLTHCPARFDVIGVWWQGSRPRIEHVKGAFELRAKD